MTIIKKIETLKNKLNSVRTNNEVNKIDKQILKLAKIYNSQNHFERFLIYNGNVYGLEKNPNYLND